MVFRNVRVILVNIKRPLKQALALATLNGWIQRLIVVDHPIWQIRKRNEHRCNPCLEFHLSAFLKFHGNARRLKFLCGALVSYRVDQLIFP